MLLCVCAHFCLVFGTVERALCHLNPFSSDWAFVSPVSEGVITDHTDAAGEFRHCLQEWLQIQGVQQQLWESAAGWKGSLHALGLFMELRLTQCNTEWPETGWQWRESGNFQGDSEFSLQCSWNCLGHGNFLRALPQMPAVINEHCVPPWSFK